MGLLNTPLEEIHTLKIGTVLTIYRDFQQNRRLTATFSEKFSKLWFYFQKSKINKKSPTFSENLKPIISRKGKWYHWFPSFYSVESFMFYRAQPLSLCY